MGSLLTAIKEAIQLFTSPANAVRTISIAGEAVQKGEAFTHRWNYAFTSSQTRLFVFTPGHLTLPIGMGVPGFSPNFSADTGPFIVNIYLNPTGVTGGTPALIFDRNSVTNNTPVSTIQANVAVTTKGTNFSQILVPATAGGPVNVGSGGATGDPFNFRIGNTYLMEVTNNDGDATLNIKFDFFELT